MESQQKDGHYAQLRERREVVEINGGNAYYIKASARSGRRRRLLRIGKLKLLMVMKVLLTPPPTKKRLLYIKAKHTSNKRHKEASQKKKGE